MGQRTETPPDTETTQVSDALSQESDDSSLWSWLRKVELWLFVDAHRWTIIGLLSGFVFLSIVSAVLLGPPAVMAYLLEGTALAKGYVELQTIDVTVITIVLTINQLVLTTELGSLGQQRSRLDDVLEHRGKVEELADAPTTPTAPEQYLQTIVTVTQKRAEYLRSTVAENDNKALRRDVDRYVDSVLRETERVANGLDGEKFGTIELIGAAMHFTTADDIHAVRSLHEKHQSTLTEAEENALTDMIDILELYTVAREYFRALYVQWEFINFSRAILYLGLPAVIIAHLSIGFINANVFPGTLFGVPNLFWYETVAFTIILAPVVVVISYAARLSMLAKASIFISPFSPEREGGHWEE